MQNHLHLHAKPTSIHAKPLALTCKTINHSCKTICACMQNHQPFMQIHLPLHAKPLTIHAKPLALACKTINHSCKTICACMQKHQPFMQDHLPLHAKPPTIHTSWRRMTSRSRHGLGTAGPPRPLQADTPVTWVTKVINAVGYRTSNGRFPKRENRTPCSACTATHASERRISTQGALPSDEGR